MAQPPVGGTAGLPGPVRPGGPSAEQGASVQSTHGNASLARLCFPGAPAGPHVGLRAAQVIPSGWGQPDRLVPRWVWCFEPSDPKWGLLAKSPACPGTQQRPSEPQLLLLPCGTVEGEAGALRFSLAGLTLIPVRRNLSNALLCKLNFLQENCGLGHT